ncbi:MAG: EB domain-containing protein [bacterium]
MKNKKLFLFTFLLLIAAIFAGSSFRDFKIEKVTADTNLPGCSDSLIGRLSGYIWSDNIGWISLGENEGTYGVGIKSDKNLCGYGWADNIGWVSFNALDLNNCPAGECTAKIDGMSNKNISGWARACAGSTDGMCGEYTGSGKILSTSTVTTYVTKPAGDTWVQKTTVNRNWSGVAMSSDGKLQTAVVNGGKIYLSKDYGETWTATSTNRMWTSVAMSTDPSTDGKYQTAVVNGGSIYTSSDYGNTWTATGCTGCGASWKKVVMSNSGQYQVAISDSALAGVSQTYGASWTVYDMGADPRGVAITSDGSKEFMAVDAGGDGFLGISINHGLTNGSWPTVNTSFRNFDNFNVMQSSADGSILTGLMAEGTIYISTTTGSKWTQLGSQYAQMSWTDVDMTADGSVQVAVSWGDTATQPGEGRIYVSTSTGLYWEKKTAPAGGWTGVAVSADGSVMTAVQENGTIYTSISPNKRIETSTTVVNVPQTVTTTTGGYGDNWLEKATDKNRNWVDVAVSRDGVMQAAVEKGGYIYESNDSGDSWTGKMTDVNRGWRSIAVSATGTYQLAAGWDGVFVSTTSGNTWVNVSKNLAGSMWTSAAMSADGSKQMFSENNYYGDMGTGCVYYSTNYGKTFLSESGPGCTGFYDTYITQNGLIKSVVGTWDIDKGAGWVSGYRGVPYGYKVNTSMSSNGTVRTVVAGSDPDLVAGFTGLTPSKIYTTKNSGTNWYQKTPNLDWQGVAMSAGGSIQAAVVSGGYLYMSTSTGDYWYPRTSDVARVWRSVAVSDNGSILTAVVYGGKIYVSKPVTSTSTINVPTNVSTYTLVDIGGTPVTTTVVRTITDPASLKGSLNGGWDGWISLSGTTTAREKYGISGLSGDALTGFAWGSDVLGWLDFFDVKIDFATCANGEVKDDNGICCPATLENNKLVTTITTGLLGQTIRNTYCQVCAGEKVEVDGQCLCPDGKEDVAGQCVTVCPEDMTYYDSQCISIITCEQLGKVTYQGTCVPSCLGGSEAVNGVCECPANEKMEFNICVPDCEALGKVKSTTGVCVDVCREGEVLFENECRTVCPDGTVDFSGQCITTSCPLGMVESNGECKDGCTDGQVAQDGICTDVCSDGLVKLAGVCVPECPSQYREVAGECVIICDEGKIEKNGQCVIDLIDCGEGYKDNGDGQCVLDCLQGYKDFGNECVLDCAVGYVESDGICVKDCGLGYKADGGQCVLDCPEGQIQSEIPPPAHCALQCSDGQVESYGECTNICADWQVNVDGICQDGCGGGEVDDNGICKNTCTPPEVEFNQECIAGCLDGYESVDGECKKICQENEYNFMDECLIDCPNGYTKDEANGMCNLDCDPGYKDVAGQCVMDCGDKIESDGVCQDQCNEGDIPIDGRCVKDCPEGQVESSDGTDCVDNCSLTEVENSGQCVADCPEGRAELLGVCVQGCPIGQTENADGKCVTDKTIQYCGGVRPYGYVRSGASSVNKALVTPSTKLVWSFMPVKTRSKDLKVCEWTCKAANSKNIYSRGGNRCFKNTIILD